MQGLKDINFHVLDKRFFWDIRKTKSNSEFVVTIFCIELILLYKKVTISSLPLLRAKITTWSNPLPIRFRSAKSDPIKPCLRLTLSRQSDWFNTDEVKPSTTWIKSECDLKGGGGGIRPWERLWNFDNRDYNPSWNKFPSRKFSLGIWALNFAMDKWKKGEWMIRKSFGVF